MTPYKRAQAWLGHGAPSLPTGEDIPPRIERPFFLVFNAFLLHLRRDRDIDATYGKSSIEGWTKNGGLWYAPVKEQANTAAEAENGKTRATRRGENKEGEATSTLDNLEGYS